MAEGSSIPHRRVVAFVVALVLAVGCAVWSVSGVAERDDAAGQLTRDRAALRLWRVAAAGAGDRVGRAREAATKLVPQLGDVSSTAETVGQLDEQELGFARDALAAIANGDVAAYNREVSSRNALIAPHDTTVESLRAKVDVLVAALEGL